jgi:hypothetical protein
VFFLPGECGNSELGFEIDLLTQPVCSYPAQLLGFLDRNHSSSVLVDGVFSALLAGLFLAARHMHVDLIASFSAIRSKPFLSLCSLRTQAEQARDSFYPFPALFSRRFPSDSILLFTLAGAAPISGYTGSPVL